MNILVQNKTSLPNKVVRFIKWKIYRLSRKFNHLQSASVYLNEEGNSVKTYYLTLNLNTVSGEIIIKHQDSNLSELLRASTKSAHRYLDKNKPLAALAV